LNQETSFYYNKTNLSLAIFGTKIYITFMYQNIKREIVRRVNKTPSWFGLA
jgi:hypothetical protein